MVKSSTFGQITGEEW